MLLQPERREFRGDTVAGPDVRSAAHTELWDELARQVQITGKPLLENGTDSPRRGKHVYPEVGQVSFAGVPILISGVARGSLSVAGPGARSWTVSDIEILEELAASAAAEIELVEEVERRASAEEALRARETFIRRVVEGATDGLLVHDLEGRIIEANAAACAMYGYEREEMRLLRLHQLAPRLTPERHAQILQSHWDAIRVSGHVIAQGTNQRRDGTLFPVEVHLSAFDPDSPTPLMIGVVRDLTWRSRAETVVREAAEHFQRVVENLGGGVIISDLNGVIKYVNAKIQELSGYSQEEMVGRVADALLIRPQDRGRLRRELRKRREGASSTYEVEILHKDGTPVWVEIHGVPHLDADGAVVGTVAAIYDISARRRAEEERTELLRREQWARTKAEAAAWRARLLAEVSESFSLAVDPTSILRSLSARMVPALADSCITYLVDEQDVIRSLPVHADPTVELHLREHLECYPATLDTLIPPVARALRSGSSELLTEVTPGALRARPDDPAHRSIVEVLPITSLLVVPLRSHDRILGAFSLGSSGRHFQPQDLELAEEVARRAALVLENAQLHRQVRQALQSREQVLQAVSHDLRNPLATILLSTTAVLESSGTPLPPEASDMLRRVTAASEQMGRLISDLSDVSLLEKGQLSMMRSRVDVGPMAKEALEMIRPLAMRKPVRLECEIVEPLTPVLVDRDRIMQVFSNLLGNAVKFTPEGGRVTVRAEQSEAMVVVSIADTGLGIDEVDVPYVFERFWKANRRSGGSGLGLAIAKGLVEAHGGRIWADARPGEGSTFSFSLPAEA